jgi:hypothetical protein
MLFNLIAIKERWHYMIRQVMVSDKMSCLLCDSMVRFYIVFYAARYLLKVSRATSEIVLFLRKGLYRSNSTINKTISEI